MGLEKGTIRCWGDGWDLGAVDLYRLDTGLPSTLEYGLDALIDDSGRILLRTAIGAVSPFTVSLQVLRDGRWRSVQRRWRLPMPPVWRTAVTRNTNLSDVNRLDVPS